MSLPRLLLLTDRTQLPRGRNLVDTVSRCVEAGLEAVVLRELDLSARERQSLAARLADTGVLVVAARTWVPAAGGVHLSATQAGIDIGAALHGRSCHDDEEVRRAVAGRASYVTISPVAPSRSKPGHGPSLGTVGVRRAVALAGRTPVFALGGVDAGNAAAMRSAGAYGVAVMGHVMRADDPAAEVRKIRDVLT
jgi:thiamine-phosphate pyrophosphorylase